MKRPFQVTLLVLSGLGLLHASLFTDLCLRYVRAGMRPMLIASGVLLLVLGVAEAWSSRREPGEGRDGEGRGGEGRDGECHDGQGHGGEGHGGEGHSHAHGHDHSSVPRVAWLLFLPALSLLFFAPPALGAYTASREAPKAVTEQRHFDPLPATSPVPLTLTDFTRRAQQDREQAIKGRSIQMTGFVAPDKKGGGWYLARIIFTCCAADAQSVKVRIYGPPALPANTWVTVTGTWHPGGTLGTKSAAAALDARTVKEVAQPVNAYSDALPLVPSS
ncbi:TIGR03943 family putative permease subunit [Streptomyces sp. NPDC001315]|uniref:TIGR03943 family putative permease subunit n=1 Tax=Streptomyces sp. NPDC001315 TaxID=3364562 RepID=UPI0036A0A6D4